MNIARKISTASHFGSYIIFELWNGAGSDNEYSLHDRNTINHGIEGNIVTVDPVQEPCSAVEVRDINTRDTHKLIQSSGIPYRCHLNDNDGDGDGESDNNLCSCDGTPPNEVTDFTACDVTPSKNIDEKIKKSDQFQNLLGLSENKMKMKNTFLQAVSDETEDRRFLRILANFSPFEARDGTVINRLNHEVNEKNTILLAELSIQEIKQKHDFLFQSLTSRGYFVPQVNASQR